ncbi:MAG: CRISPR-associated endonuclease Cas2 [Deltaproteobacteria bacterium]|nr:CRISPR-associated endonuclease Cas2 [Deltaproteobacteria bacterium]
MHCYIISYDIADNDRRNAVCALVLAFGERVQYSVYSCILSAPKFEELRAALTPMINHAEDQVLMIDLGPLDGRGSRCVSSIGRSYSGGQWAPLIL